MQRLHDQQLHRSGFTIVEILAAGALVTFVGIFGVTAYYAVTNAQIRNESQIKAINYTQRIMERAMALSNANYDTFNTASLQTALNSDTALSGPEFSGYTYSLNVTQSASNAQVDQIDVTVNWAFQGKPQSFQYSLLVTRPPVGLPGDIAGTITDSATGDPVPSAKVTACFEYIITPPTPATPCFVVNADTNGYYTFKSQTYRLKPGHWSISAMDPNYQDYKDPIPAVPVFSGQQTIYNFKMVHNPQPGIIQVDAYAVDKDGKPILDTKGHLTAVSSFVSLFHGCGLAWGINSSEGGWPFSFHTPASFTIPFVGNNLNATQQNFTVVTSYSGNGCGWKGSSGENGNDYYPYAPNAFSFISDPDSTLPSVGLSQNACPSPFFGTPYDFRGWSSSIFTPQEIFSQTASVTIPEIYNCNYNSFVGNPDNVPVYPGRTTYVHIPLTVNPTATLTGHVYYHVHDYQGPAGNWADGSNQPESQGTIYVYWGPGTPNSNPYSPEHQTYFSSATIGLDGSYSLTIPAAQELFGDHDKALDKNGNYQSLFYSGVVVCSAACNEKKSDPSAIQCGAQYGFPGILDNKICSQAFTAPLPVVYATNPLTNAPQDMSLGPVTKDTGTITRDYYIWDVGLNMPGPGPLGCWELKGHVYNAYTGAPINHALVTLISKGSDSIYSQADGSVYFPCVGGFDPYIPNPSIAPWKVEAWDVNGYYSYFPFDDRVQHAWYNWDWQVNVLTPFMDPNSPDFLFNAGFYLPDIYLIPAEYGDKVKVIVQDTNDPPKPLAGFYGELVNINGTAIPSSGTLVTDSNGEMDFVSNLVKNEFLFSSWFTPTFENAYNAGTLAPPTQANPSIYYNMTIGGVGLNLYIQPPSSIYNPVVVYGIPIQLGHTIVGTNTHGTTTTWLSNTVTPGQTLTTVYVTVTKNQGT